MSISEWVFNILRLILGGLLLWSGADFLVFGGKTLAKKANIPRFLIGLVFMAFATSLPELIVSIQAAFHNNADISLGNVIGSNICNIGIVLGACALVRPLPLPGELKEFNLSTMMFAAIALTAFYYLNHGINRWEGMFFLVCLAAYVILNWRMMGKVEEDTEDEDKFVDRILFLCQIPRKIRSLLLRPTPSGSGRSDRNNDSSAQCAQTGFTREMLFEKMSSTSGSFLLFVGGILMLPCGSRFLVDSAVAIAGAAGISKAVIGLTIVAIGTSLPELVTSLMASLSGENEIAFGNIVGSNIFNIFCILGVVPVISPLAGQSIHMLDFAVMLAISGALFLFGMFGKRLSRVQGALLLAAYIAYTVYLVMHHA